MDSSQGDVDVNWNSGGSGDWGPPTMSDNFNEWGPPDGNYYPQQDPSMQYGGGYYDTYSGYSPSSFSYRGRGGGRGRGSFRGRGSSFRGRGRGSHGYTGSKRMDRNFSEVRMKYNKECK